MLYYPELEKLGQPDMAAIFPLLTKLRIRLSARVAFKLTHTILTQSLNLNVSCNVQPKMIANTTLGTAKKMKIFMKNVSSFHRVKK